MPNSYGLGVPEVCQQLGVRPYLVYKLAANRELAHVRVGKFLRFAQEDIDDYLARQRVEAQPQGSR
jgi:excisionase family DNA binding protein